MDELRPEPRRSELRLVCFHLGEQRFGASIDQVKETIVLRPITRVFLLPSWAAGIINLRGDVVAVLDLASFLGLPPAQRSADARIIIARCGGRTVGLLVDRLTGARSVDPAVLEPPTGLAPEESALATGVVTLEDGAPLLVLDLARLFNSERLRQFQRKGQE